MIRKKEINNYILLSLVLIMILLSSYPVQGANGWTIDVGSTGIEARIYYLADVDPSTVDLEDRSEVDRIERRQQDNNISPENTILSKEDGTMFYQPQNRGLYLIRYSRGTVGDYTVLFSSTLLVSDGTGLEFEPKREMHKTPIIPGPDTGSGRPPIIVDDPLEPGIPQDPTLPDGPVVPPGGDTGDILTELEIVVTWPDGVKNIDSITVHLLKDGVVIDTVVLSPDNNWRHTWHGLDPASDYSVNLTLPDGYSYSTDRYGHIIYVCVVGKDTIPTKPGHGGGWWYPYVGGSGYLGKTRLPRVDIGTDLVDEKITDDKRDIADKDLLDDKLPELCIGWIIPIILIVIGTILIVLFRRKYRSFISILGAVLIALGILIIIYHLISEIGAGRDSKYIMDQMKLDQTISQEQINPEEQIPTETYDGTQFIGSIDIPKLDKELPVTSTYNNNSLKSFPSRYAGDRYEDHLVIMSYKYWSHLGRISRLEIDDTITYTDVLGRSTEYVVLGMDIIDEHDVKGMVDVDYDLTLFTCGTDCSNRIAIRAVRVK